MARKIEINVERYEQLMEKYMKEDLGDMLGIDASDAPSSHAAVSLMAKATDEVLADDVLDGAARWYAYKATVKMQRQLLELLNGKAEK